MRELLVPPEIISSSPNGFSAFSSFLVFYALFSFSRVEGSEALGGQGFACFPHDLLGRRSSLPLGCLAFFFIFLFLFLLRCLSSPWRDLRTRRCVSIFPGGVGQSRVRRAGV